MTASEPIRILRPSDLLVLSVDIDNLAPSVDGLRLERVDASAEAVLVFTFPTQHVGEQAFGDRHGVPEPLPEPPVSALAAGPSRLAFTLKPDVDGVPLTVAGLLNWSMFEPRLVSNALPPGAPGGSGPAPKLPAPDQTGLELHYRLVFSPDAHGRWEHRKEEPAGAHGRVEVWHTQLSSHHNDRAHIRAVARRPVDNTMRMPVTEADLDDIVRLSADFSVRPKSSTELGLPFSVWQQRLAQAGLLEHPFRPEPLQAHQLILTALGASVRLRGTWNFPGANHRRDLFPQLGMPQPSLTQVEFTSGMGRDEKVRVVRRFYTHTGHRAVVVTITERVFPTQPSGRSRSGTAYLRQRQELFITEPYLDYRKLAGGYQHQGREMPLRDLTFVTTTARIDMAPSSQTRRWASFGKNTLMFTFTATDWDNRTITGSMPLLIIPEPDVLNATAVRDAYNKASPLNRRVDLKGQIVAIAEHPPGQRGATAAPASSMDMELVVVSARRASRLPANYVPRWLPRIKDSTIHLETVERLTGRATSVSVRLSDDHLNASSRAVTSGHYADLREGVTVSLPGADSGGVGRVEHKVSALTTTQGAVAKAVAAGQVSQGDVASVFAGARLLGSIKVADVVAAPGALSAEHFAVAHMSDEQLEALLVDTSRRIEIPLLRTRKVYLRDGSGLPVPAVESRFLWKPSLRETLPPGVPLEWKDNAELVLDARLAVPVGGGDPIATSRGELRRFTLTLAGVVNIGFDRLAFQSTSGLKPEFTVEGLTVTFAGPLQFVNTLQEIIPSKHLRDGPKVAITPRGVAAQCSVAVPTVGVGVFSLQNLAVTAEVQVPFDNRPAGLRFALSSRQDPFLVTVTMFGGGGFFALGVSANGVEEIEAAIEFGGSVSLNLGVASGGVYVMAGVYFGLTKRTTTLTGYLRCGGHLSVLGLISLALEFYLAFTWRSKPGGGSEVWGQARLQVSVKVACFSKSVTLSIERRFSGGAGDPTLEQVMSSTDWEDYCLAFAPEVRA